MAYSIIEFADKSFRFHDLDLTIACVFIIEQRGTKRVDLFDRMFEGWIDSFSFDGSGCIDLHLDEHLIDSESKVLLIEKIELVLRNLDEFSESFPKVKLNKLLAKVKINLENNYRIDLITIALEEMKILLTIS